MMKVVMIKIIILTIMSEMVSDIYKWELATGGWQMIIIMVMIIIMLIIIVIIMIIIQNVISMSVGEQMLAGHESWS